MVVNMNGKNKNERLQACQDEIINKLRGASRFADSDLVSATAFLLADIAKYNYPFGVDLEIAIEDVARDGIDVGYVANVIDKQTWDTLIELCMNFGPDDFLQVAAMPVTNTDKRDYLETPAYLEQLATKLLDVHEGDKIADFCCGHGGVAIELAQVNPQIPVKGFELKEHVAATAKIRVLASGANVDISVCDVFEIPGGEEKFDKIFCNYPFGLNLRELGTNHSYLQTIAQKVPSVSRATSSDWVFNHLLIDVLNEDGKAVGIMTNGSTWNTIDRNTREYFVEQGYIECIIALPAKLFASTNIPTTLIVLSRGNKEVHMVDATEVCTKGRRQNTLSESDIKKIITACHADSDISKVLSVGELRESDFVLHPGRYFAEDIDEGVPFESVIKSISRGAHCTAEQLDNMSTQEETNIHFLKTSDIQDGIIAGRMQSLSYIEDNFEKYCIKNNSLVISKVGAPYKVAVAAVHDNERILANANLYVVELDESKVDPYYLKAFFESEEGQARFKSITVGATVLSIGVKDLKAMRIPLPPLEEQRKVAARCKDVLEEIAQLKKQLELATQQLANVFSGNT